MKIIFTIGDCNGIGLECFFKTLIKFSADSKNSDVDFFIAGNKKTIYEYAEKCNFDFLSKRQLKEIDNNRIYFNDLACEIINCAECSPVEFGKETLDAGRLAASSLKYAAKETFEKKFDAAVTLPVSKKSLYSAGWEFPGQTEFFASVCAVKNPLMLLFLGNIRIALATIHVPLEDVPKSINQAELIRTLEIFNKSLLIDFGIKNGRIAVLGLNPHAGESGSIGREESAIIEPAINDCKAKGIRAKGPFPADGFFGFGEYKKYDGILAMYHDQGLIPLKQLSKGNGVNFTAGLPIVRCSPDHGTGFSIAGKGIANECSSLKSLLAAIEIAKSRKKLNE